MSKRDTVGSGDDMSEEDTNVSEEVTHRNKKSKPHQPAAQLEKRRNPATSQRKVSPGSGKSNPASGSGGNGGAKDNRPRNSHHSTSEGGSRLTVNSHGREVSLSSSSASSGKGNGSHGGTSTSQQGKGDRGGGATSNSDSHDGARTDHSTDFNDPDGFLKRERDFSMQQLHRYTVQFSYASVRFQQTIEGCIDRISSLSMEHENQSQALEQECDLLLDMNLFEPVLDHALNYENARSDLIEEMKIFKDGWDVCYRLRGGASLQPGSAVDSTATATSSGDNGAGSGALGPAQEATSASAPENFTFNEDGNYAGRLLRVERHKYKNALEDNQRMRSRFVEELSGMCQIHKKKSLALELECQSLDEDEHEPVLDLTKKYNASLQILWKETHAILPVCTKIRKWK